MSAGSDVFFFFSRAEDARLVKASEKKMIYLPLATLNTGNYVGVEAAISYF